MSMQYVTMTINGGFKRDNSTLIFKGPWESNKTATQLKTGMCFGRVTLGSWCTRF